jgi:hypothetical protein
MTEHAGLRVLFWFLPLCCAPAASRFGVRVFLLIYDSPTEFTPYLELYQTRSYTERKLRCQ